MARRESHLRSVLKGISWRIVASTATILLTILVAALFGRMDVAEALQLGLKVGAAEFFIKLAVYYIHERIWQRRIGYEGHRDRALMIKSVTWRILASMTGFLIVFFFIDQGHGDTNEHGASTQAAVYTALDFVTKLVLFYLHEKLWHSLPYGRIRAFIRKSTRRFRRT